MRLRGDIDVGVSTNTGPVRSANEDDYLAFEPESAERMAAVGRLFVVADGMGGVAGGAEASRIAVRSLMAEMLRVAGSDRAAGVRRGFDAAAKQIYEASLANRQLADMGTTLTALSFGDDGRGVVGHVGDSRCVVLRGGRLERLTEDHAVEEPRHLLTRCLGAGREEEETDIVTVSVEEGDVFALMTDGVWGVLDDAVLAQTLRGGTAQECAQRLVERAFEAGSTDNATALVIRVLGEKHRDQVRDADLPADEAGLHLDELAEPPSRESWPWLVLVLGVGLAVAATLKFAGVW